MKKDSEPEGKLHPLSERQHQTLASPALAWAAKYLVLTPL
ncbi:hypothetical protein RISK_004724 [Rhodopirellula islandica]|uniref:Uncharacterized protein n=1 Tax=Rhodopirellula islandica TaxID=595434 RepID=A0A0J1B9M3_RHOIS|nr:hypothetical protein RISK_004724 [Rhodopirellula islandica]